MKIDKRTCPHLYEYYAIGGPSTIEGKKYYEKHVNHLYLEVKIQNQVIWSRLGLSNKKIHITYENR